MYSSLYAQGLRYRIHARPERDIRRTADMLFLGAKAAMLIDGCYWQGCPDHFPLARHQRELLGQEDQSQPRARRTHESCARRARLAGAAILGARGPSGRRAIYRECRAPGPRGSRCLSTVIDTDIDQICSIATQGWETPVSQAQRALRGQPAIRPRPITCTSTVSGVGLRPQCVWPNGHVCPRSGAVTRLSPTRHAPAAVLVTEYRPRDMLKPDCRIEIS